MAEIPPTPTLNPKGLYQKISSFCPEENFNYALIDIRSEFDLIADGNA